ncbi:Cysteine protease atg4 [Podila epigama]|nr:Cysteine protease atg4 [Podila epigama]
MQPLEKVKDELQGLDKGPKTSGNSLESPQLTTATATTATTTSTTSPPPSSTVSSSTGKEQPATETETVTAVVDEKAHATTQNGSVTKTPTPVLDCPSEATSTVRPSTTTTPTVTATVSNLVTEFVEKGPDGADLKPSPNQGQQDVAGPSTPATAAPSSLGSRFSVHLSNVGIPSMATNLGITQANSERAADMAQDIKKNVVNMWNAWFPAPTNTGEPSQSTGTDVGKTTPIHATVSGTQSLSQHSQQRPGKAQRVNSYTMGAKIGSDVKNLALSSLQAVRANSQDSQVRPEVSLSNSSSGHNSQQTSPGATDREENGETTANNAPGRPSSTASSTVHSPNSHLPIYLMGKLYPPSPTQWFDFQRDFTNGLIWCTYRHSYAPIKPSNFTTDVGWGCMLRSGQGLLANALAIQFMGRGWSRPVPGDANWDVYVKILYWFLDDMNAKSPFSVHRIALLGKQLGKNIGEWFGPSTTSQVTKALVHNFPESGLGVYVSTDGVIYKDQVEEAATLKKKDGFGHLLILVTVRLGIDKLNPIYNDAIKATFEFPQSLGIAGGRPSSSYYFVGYQGDDLFYLDPHHSRCVVETKDPKDYVAEDFATYHCEVVRKIDINSIDPSMLLAFYCRDRNDFDAFAERVKELNARPGMGSSIITIGEKAPDYGDDADGHLLSVADEEDDDLELIL